jgi:glycosyltransferase involved in cell wall biosynthesis
MISEVEKVSIVLPTFNGEKYLRQSLESCLKQTYRNIEVIIVDDGSTETTPQFIHSCEDNRIISIRHDRNRGLPHSLNSGFAAATGNYLTWTSDDNYYAEEALEKMLSFLKTTRCSFVYCDYYLFDDGNPDALSLMQLPEMPTLAQRNTIGPCFLYSRTVGERIGDYDPDTRLAEDYDYWLRVAKKFAMHHLAEPLYFYRLHPRSLTTVFSKEYEIKVVDLLVRLKNNSIAVTEANELCISYTKRNMETRFTSPRAKNRFGSRGTLPRRALMLWHNAVVTYWAAKQIHKTLVRFTNKGLNVTDAKIILTNIISGKRS